MISFINAEACKQNEVRLQCAPNKLCRTCGVHACTRECNINACICKEGYKYFDTHFQVCVPESECPTIAQQDNF
jgi:hypothetical protein